MAPPATPLLLLLLLLGGAAHGAPAPWVTDPLLNTLAGRYWGQQLVAGPTDLSTLDALVVLSLATLDPVNCTFTDVDYAGESSAFWPAMNHSVRARAMATAAVSPGSAYFNSTAVAQSAYCALGWWLSHDPRNPNWWYMDIGSPGYLAPTALLLWPLLTEAQVAQLGVALARTSYRGYTGANLVWTAANVAWRGLLAGNRSEVEAALAAALSTVAVAPGLTEGIKTDGSFFQHGNQLYSGGYGQAFAYDVTNLLGLVAGTPLAATSAQVQLFSQWLVEGSFRMIHWGRPQDGQGPGMWDVAAVGRDVSRPYGSFLQFGFGTSAQQVSWVASALSSIGGPFAPQLSAVAARLNGSAVGAPAFLTGHKHFWQADYAVATHATWMASVRMQSNRTLRSECVNGENGKGLHLADGTMFVYKSGYEYSGVFPAWDWQRLPGTTVKIDAVPLACATVQGGGSSAFTGGASEGGGSSRGVATQNFSAPLDAGLSLLRHVGFQDDSLAVVLANISSFATPGGAGAQHNVSTTLESCVLDVVGGVWVGSLGGGGAPRELPLPADATWAPGSAGAPGWLWHNGSGYVLTSFAAGASPALLRLVANLAASGAWAAIGAEGAYGNVTLPLFSLWLELLPGDAVAAGGAPAAYTVVPDVGLAQFAAAVGARADAYGGALAGPGWLATCRSDSGGSGGYLAASVFAAARERARLVRRVAGTGGCDGERRQPAAAAAVGGHGDARGHGARAVQRRRLQLRRGRRGRARGAPRGRQRGRDRGSHVPACHLRGRFLR